MCQTFIAALFILTIKYIKINVNQLVNKSNVGYPHNKILDSTIKRNEDLEKAFGLVVKMPTSPSECLFSRTSSSSQFQCPTNSYLSDSSSSWVPTNHLKDLGCIPISQLQPGSVVAGCRNLSGEYANVHSCAYSFSQSHLILKIKFCYILQHR